MQRNFKVTQFNIKSTGYFFIHLIHCLNPAAILCMVIEESAFVEKQTSGNDKCTGTILCHDIQYITDLIIFQLHHINRSGKRVPFIMYGQCGAHGRGLRY